MTDKEDTIQLGGGGDFLPPPVDNHTPPWDTDGVKKDFVSEINELVDYHREQLAIWEAALRAAKKGKDTTKNKRGGQPQEKAAAPTKTPNTPTAFVEDAIRNREGITAGEIKKRAVGKYFARADNFPYKVLSRLNRKGRIYKDGSRYFSSEEKAKASA